MKMEQEQANLTFFPKTRNLCTIFPIFSLISPIIKKSIGRVKMEVAVDMFQIFQKFMITKNIQIK